MKTFNQGEEVLVRAQVLRSRIDPKADPSYHSIDLQLPDGQLLQTNVRNLHQPEAKAMESAPENKAVEVAPETKAVKPKK
jgi:hypothetical protein